MLYICFEILAIPSTFCIKAHIGLRDSYFKIQSLTGPVPAVLDRVNLGERQTRRIRLTYHDFTLHPLSLGG